MKQRHRKHRRPVRWDGWVSIKHPILGRTRFKPLTNGWVTLAEALAVDPEAKPA